MKHFRYFLLMSFGVLTLSVLMGGCAVKNTGFPHGQYTGREIQAYPTELYSTDNVITLINPDGIQAIKPIFDSVTASLVKIKSVDDLSSYPDTATVHLYLYTVAQSVNVQFLVTDAKGRRSKVFLSNRTWQIDEVSFPEVMVGDTVCQPFQVGTAFGGPNGSGTGEFLDSISMSVPEAWLRSSYPPPIQIRPNSTYRYRVCFSAPVAGDYKFAVIGWMRRAQPAGGFTNYPVADRALVTVLPK